MNSHPLKITPDQKNFSLRILGDPSSYPWQIIVIFMVVGGLVGLLLSVLKTPVYEASATLTTNMELVRNSNITEIMVDAEIEHVGTLPYYPEIIDKLIQKEKEQGNTISLEYLKKNGSIERELMNTFLKVRGPDPEVAARIATEWAQITFDRLQQAFPYAVAVSSAKQQLQEIDSCLNDPKKLDVPFCKNLTADQADQIIETANQTIIAQSPYTLGLTVALNVSDYQPASVPTEPLWNARGTLVLSAMLVGLIVGIIFNEIKSKPAENHES